MGGLRPHPHPRGRRLAGRQGRSGGGHAGRQGGWCPGDRADRGRAHLPAPSRGYCRRRPHRHRPRGQPCHLRRGPRRQSGPRAHAHPRRLQGRGHAGRRLRRRDLPGTVRPTGGRLRSRRRLGGGVRRPRRQGRGHLGRRRRLRRQPGHRRAAGNNPGPGPSERHCCGAGRRVGPDDHLGAPGHAWRRRRVAPHHRGAGRRHPRHRGAHHDHHHRRARASRRGTRRLRATS